MDKRYLIINTKLYSEAFNDRLEEMLKALENLKEKAEEKNVELILVPEIMDLPKSASRVKTFSQHCDPVEPGNHTGYISPKHVYDKGGKGTLLNHSEHRISYEKIKDTVNLAKKNKLITCVCIESPEEISEVLSSVKPDMFAYEPRELIGGDVSVSSKQPESIEIANKLSGEIPLLVGAGIKNSYDIEKSIELGSKGVLVASGIDKAENKQQAIEDLLKGF